jgi:hypothetical protein
MRGRSHKAKGNIAVRGCGCKAEGNIVVRGRGHKAKGNIAMRGCGRKAEGISRKGRSAQKSSNMASKQQSSGFEPRKWQPRVLTKDIVENNAGRYVNIFKSAAAKSRQHRCCLEFIWNTGAPLR